MNFRENNPSSKKPTTRSLISQSYTHSVGHLKGSQSILKSVSQAVTRSIREQSVSLYASQSVSHDQSVSHSLTQSVSQTDSQTDRQTVGQSLHQSFNRSITQNKRFILVLKEQTITTKTLHHSCLRSEKPTSVPPLWKQVIPLHKRRDAT